VAAFSRRKLVVLGVSLGGLALAGAGVYAWRRTRFESLATDARSFALAMADGADKAGVNISDAIVLRWCEDYELFGGKLKRRKGRVSRRQLESLILSTDFFDASTDGVTQYVTHYNPHKNPCFNPLRVVS
jgi:hypothetical protein